MSWHWLLLKASGFIRHFLLFGIRPKKTKG